MRLVHALLPTSELEHPPERMRWLLLISLSIIGPDSRFSGPSRLIIVGILDMCLLAAFAMYMRGEVLV